MYVDEKNKKCKCPAPDYVNLVMSDCQKSIKDESVFPTKYGKLQFCVSDSSRKFKTMAKGKWTAAWTQCADKCKQIDKITKEDSIPEVSFKTIVLNRIM